MLSECLREIPYQLSERPMVSRQSTNIFSGATMLGDIMSSPGDAMPRRRKFMLRMHYRCLMPPVDYSRSLKVLRWWRDTKFHERGTEPSESTCLAVGLPDPQHPTPRPPRTFLPLRGRSWRGHRGRLPVAVVSGKRGAELRRAWGKSLRESTLSTGTRSQTSPR